MTTITDLTAPNTPLTAYQAALAAALQSAGANSSTSGGTGSVANIDTPALQALLNAAIAWLQQYVDSTDPQVASYAFNQLNLLQIQNQTLNPLGNNLTTLMGQINPNLWALALQWYGDVAQWKAIAAENGIVTPFPIGIYNLVIPALS